MKALTHVTIPIEEFRQLQDFCALNERQRRGMYGFIAYQAGFGGMTAVARALDVAPITVRRGLDEYTQVVASAKEEAPEAKAAEGVGMRIRKEGAGRKSVQFHQPGLLDALRGLLEETTYGDPQKVLLWTTLSLRKLSEHLNLQGFKVSHTVVGELLEELGYSKQCNQKMLQVNEPHPHRDEQFRFINAKANAFLQAGDPVISIDCKKKENIGNFKNNGQEYRPLKQARKVLDHDFALLKVAPYGIYVLNDNTGFVNLGTSSDTAQFAGESVGRWWHHVGEQSFPGRKRIFITCDGGGSNGCRIRLWKWVLATIAQKYGLQIHVSHFPPGTSKWNKVEHRLFSYITKNWQGKPLVDIDTVVSLIGATTTTTGLTVTCQVDTTEYQRGIKISDEDFAKIDMEPIGEFGQWNYVVRGFKT